MIFPTGAYHAGMAVGRIPACSVNKRNRLNVQHHDRLLSSSLGLAPRHVEMMQCRQFNNVTISSVHNCLVVTVAHHWARSCKATPPLVKPSKANGCWGSGIREIRHRPLVRAERKIIEESHFGWEVDFFLANFLDEFFYVMKFHGVRTG